jgi:zinc protease
VPQVQPLPAREGRRVLLVDKPGAAQTYFWLGNVGVARGDEGDAAQELVNTVFGGRFTSMLNTELRIKSGLSYGAGSSLQRRQVPGASAISSFTRTDATEQALDLALATLDRLHADGVSPEMLASARNYVLGQFPPDLETNGQIADALTDLWLYQRPVDDIDGFAERVAAVDEAALRAAIAQAYPTSDNLVMVLIGDAAKIREVAKKYGPVTEMKITDPRFRP